MIGRSTLLRYSLATLVVVILLALGLRLGAQSSALGAAQSELGDTERNADDLKLAAERAEIGPPLLDAKVSPPEDQVKQLLAGLGVTVSAARVTGVSAAGPRFAVVKIVADGSADATALDRVALWAQANARSVVLERLTASARADGRSDVRIELDVLARGVSLPVT
ncbi:MAG TPA: hypothetical protein VHW60_16125 [Caulobacteraceae bacterium]|jgi:hypothetical protein|nr:hypothetical protein [Caulobacteraceae bacterium]